VGELAAVNAEIKRLLADPDPSARLNGYRADPPMEDHITVTVAIISTESAGVR
jgi:hypothetical protein